MVQHADKAMLAAYVHRFTRPETRIYSDKWRGYEGPAWPHETMHHKQREWARDGDDDDRRKVHINTTKVL